MNVLRDKFWLGILYDCLARQLLVGFPKYPKSMFVCIVCMSCDTIRIEYLVCMSCVYVL